MRCVHRSHVITIGFSSIQPSGGAEDRCVMYLDMGVLVEAAYLKEGIALDNIPTSSAEPNLHLVAFETNYRFQGSTNTSASATAHRSRWYSTRLDETGPD